MMADKTKTIRLLQTARGQLEGVIRMMEEDRYCLDISQQLMAAGALLNKANREILTAHLTHCVHDAAGPDREAKLNELAAVLGQILK